VGQRRPDLLQHPEPAVHGERQLQVGVVRRAVAHLDVRAGRRRVGEHQRACRARHLQVSGELVAELPRLGQVAEVLAQPAERAVLGRLPDGDELAEQAGHGHLQERRAVHPAQRDGARPAGPDHLDRAVQLVGDAERAREVVVGADRQQADEGAGAGQRAEHHAQCAVAARHDDARGVPHLLADVASRVELEDLVVGERLPHPRLDLGRERAGAPAEDQDRAGPPGRPAGAQRALFRETSTFRTSAAPVSPAAQPVNSP